MSDFPNNQEAVELQLARVETIHVSTGQQKVASLCLIVKDSDAVSELIDNPVPTPTMIIVDVVPVSDDPNHVDVFFRNLTSDEILERSRKMFIPQNLTDSIVDSLFGPMAQLLGQPEIEVELKDDLNNSPEPVTKENISHVFEELGVDANGLFEDFMHKLEETNKITVSPNRNLYRIRMTLAEAHLAQMLCVSTNAPAFVLTSESMYSPVGPNTIAVWDDFIALLEFPYTDSPAYFDATALLIQAVTGRFPLNITVEEVNKMRSVLASSIIRISKGSSRALIESFGMINPFNKTLNRQLKTEKLEKNDALNIFKNDTINRLYEVTNPKTLVSLLKGSPETPQEILEKANLEELFAETGLETMFQEVLDETYAVKPFRLNAIPTTEEVLAYYSTPISLDTLPPELQAPVARVVNMPMLFEHNWISGNVNIEITKHNTGEIAVSKLITVAVRLARLEEIARINNDDKFIPLAVVLTGMAFPGEPPFWLYYEAINQLIDNEEGGDLNLLFETLLTTGFPKSVENSNPNIFMNTPFVGILHILGHKLTSKWDEMTLRSLIEEQNPEIAQLIASMFDKVHEFEDEENDDTRGPCPIYQTIYEFLTEREDAKPVLIAHEVGNLIRAVAEHLAKAKHPELERETPDWNQALKREAHNLFEDED